MNYQPIVIIGAPRSGTNMLRDVLCEFQGVGTWPCDEINYIWRHGNIRSETDEYTIEMARPDVKKFIRKEFDQFAKQENLNFLIEKTCANSLRVPFVDQVVPEAKYIFIVRDGVDAVGSATLRWKAKLDIPYILKKVRYVPWSDLPYYGFRYIGSRIYKFFSKEQRLSFWGPQFNGLNEALDKYSLEEVCALQWQRCVDLSEDAFQKMSDDKIVRVKYEDFVSNPVDELTRILQELHIPFETIRAKEAVKSVTSRSIGKGRKALNDGQLKAVSGLLSETLQRYGYDS
ncbi:sulfotransferase [Thiomicrorhabdus sp. zzn3]|uniref:sulfotransferase family protein n=1 Tax=Thiomicrorhabdus sp. zzn3 TaxID=3039775 RepID=UPI0024367738|nr:sulfotransferase [Thiomicrorhabdus sp. zzn3]MDG6777375.1 sulfotransferase [Thiomicrorhabdus sp. zzn3]